MKLSLRTLDHDDMHIVTDMAAREGWNPGLSDGPAFFAADPQGFLVAELAGQVAGCISAVSYGDSCGGSFGFIGLFIVAPELRGQGVGSFLWKAGMDRLSGQVIGLDGVPAQQDYYRRKGFELAWQNVRFSGTAQNLADASAAPAMPPGELIALTSVDFSLLRADDRAVFPAPRDAFWHAWLNMPGAIGLARQAENGQLQGWGLIRPCREGYKIGPLLADDADIAGQIAAALCQKLPSASNVYLDVPMPNTSAMAFARRQNMQPVFETARMYCGPAPACAIDRVYGVTSFELG